MTGMLAAAAPQGQTTSLAEDAVTWRLAALPIVNYNSDFGLGGGLDAPQFAGSKLRWIVRGGYSVNLAAYWYGPDSDRAARQESPRFLHQERTVWTQLGARLPLTDSST